MKPKNYCIFSITAAFQYKRVGGAETSLLQTAIQLAKTGQKVIYVYDNTLPVNKAQVAEFSKYGLRTVSLDIPWLSRCASLMHVKRYYQLFKTWRFLQILRRRRVDVVYSYYEPKAIRRLNECKKKEGEFYWIMRMAGLFWYEDIVKTPGKIDLYQQCFANVDCVNYIQPHLRELTDAKALDVGLKMNWRDEFIWDIGCDAFGALSSKKIRTNKKSDTFRLISATRFSVHQKRQDVLVRAIAHCREHVDVHLTLVGDGKGKQRIIDLVESLGVADNVSFIPYLNQNELWSLLKTADLFCHPTDYEGLSKVVIEAINLGLPVLASDVPVLNNYLVDGENGFLVDNSPESWAERIVYLYDNYDILSGVATNAISEFDSSAFNPQKQIKEFIALTNAKLGKTDH